MHKCIVRDGISTSADLSRLLLICMFVFVILFDVYFSCGISVYGRDGVLPQWIFSGKEGGWKKMPAKDIRETVKEIMYVLAPSKPGPKHIPVNILNPDNSANHISS